jgi:hypothetical protein
VVEEFMCAHVGSLARRSAALLAVALLTAPTVLSLAVVPWVLWLAAELGGFWPSAVVAGCLAAAAAYVALGTADRYFQLRPFEASGRIYERLGVRLFRRFVVGGDYFNRAAGCYDAQYRGVRSLTAARQAERLGRLSERLHVAGLAFLVPPTCCALLVGRLDLVLALGLINMLTNLYPIMLQRYTRPRLVLLAMRSSSRHTSNCG